MSKKPNPLDDPPTASSSEDDDVESSAGSEEQDSSSSSEQDSPTKPPPSTVTIAIPGKPTTTPKEPSESETGSETETESDSDSPPPQGSTKPTNVKTNKKDSDLPPITLALSAVKTSLKRPLNEGTTSKDTKRAKKVTSGEDEGLKKPAFQRLWSEEDEIAVLQGMIDFKSETGKSPYEDTNLYYDFIKKSISFEVSKNQFMDKIRSLKKKYMGKEKPAFTKAHDIKSWKLSKYIWGPEGMGLESAVKSNGVSKKSLVKSKKIDSVKQELVFGDSSSSPNGKEEVVVVKSEERKSDWFESSFLVRMIAGFGVDESLVKEKWRLVPVEEKKKIEKDVKALQAKELEFVLQKTEFLRQVTSMIVEASKNK